MRVGGKGDERGREYMHACMLSCFICVWLWNAMDCSPPDPSVYGILQARKLKWGVPGAVWRQRRDPQRLPMARTRCLRRRPKSGWSARCKCIRVFSSESTLHQMAKGLELQLHNSPSNEYSELISFRNEWFDLLAEQGTAEQEFFLTPPFESVSGQRRPRQYWSSYWLPYGLQQCRCGEGEKWS